MLLSCSSLLSGSPSHLLIISYFHSHWRKAPIILTHFWLLKCLMLIHPINTSLFQTIIGRDLRKLSGPIFCSKKHQLWGHTGLFRVLSSWVLKTFKARDHTTSLGNPFHWWIVPRVKKILFPVKISVVSPYVCYKFPREQSEANQSAVPQIVLLALFEVGCNICFPPFIGDLPWPLWLFKNVGKWPFKDIS